MYKKPIKTYNGYNIFLSEKPDKKYYALVNGRKVYFGQSDYGQYHDKLGYYSFLDHYDDKRRYLYRKRASNIKNKKGYKTFNIPGTANYFSYNLLW